MNRNIGGGQKMAGHGFCNGFLLCAYKYMSQKDIELVYKIPRI